MPGDTQTIDQKFISLENLTQYDENIKDWVDDKVVELTYAQYSVLDPSVQNNGTTYLITDRVSGTLGQYNYNDLTNKPTLGTASAKDVATSGDASTTQVVMGNDSRLTDARNAADVYSWAKAATKPTYTASEVGAVATSETNMTFFVDNDGILNVTVDD